MLLFMLISGSRQFENDIDVYQSTLIEDLIVLWLEEINVYDAYSSETFKMRTILFYIFNDFSAYGYFSGYSVKGYKVCHLCEFNACFCQLQYEKKYCLPWTLEISKIQ